MGNWSKVVVVLVILSVGVAFGGYVAYNKLYVAPHKELENKIVEFQQKIDYAKKYSEQMTATSTSLESLYTRSFPTMPDRARQQYQIWLTQMLDFCNFDDAKVSVPAKPYVPSGYTATQRFQITGNCTLLDLANFLYEFYWTPFLHRITVMDVQPLEHSDLLTVSMTIEGLTILYKSNPNQAYPLAEKLPLTVDPPRQLSSGPFAAYRQMGDLEIFRAVKTGVDPASYAVLTGTPVITDDEGNVEKACRWNLGTEGRTESYKIGERMKIGAFDATVVDIDAELVILRQESSDRLWAVQIGHKLSDAVAIPSNLF